jgi:hypothetical protein
MPEPALVFRIDRSEPTGAAGTAPGEQISAAVHAALAAREDSPEESMLPQGAGPAVKEAVREAVREARSVASGPVRPDSPLAGEMGIDRTGPASAGLEPRLKSAHR